MAALTTATPALLELANSLSQDEIPIKLRCAICNKLALNAFRLPCCDQSICESCHASLPAACPVCEHTPLSAEDCKPNKALRTTTKVFLRTEEKKRETAKAQKPSEGVANPPESGVAPPALSSTANDTRIPESVVFASGTESGLNTNHVKHETPSDGVAAEVNGNGPAEEDIPRPSIEQIEKGQELKEIPDVPPTSAVEKDQGSENRVALAEEGKNFTGAEHHQPSLSGGSEAQWNGVNPVQASMFNGGGFGMDGGGMAFGNMGWNNQPGFDPMMQQMQQMQGLPGGAFGAFPNMMGFPGPNLDPMAMSQGMYGGYGGQGMDMNSMAMGMGMGYNAGISGYDGWNGQSGWIGGDDKFNPNAYGSNASVPGDYGANAGYHAGGGYHPSPHGNYSQMSHAHYQSNDFQNGSQGHGHPTRDRGRGRGYGSHQGLARPGHSSSNQGTEPFQQQVPVAYQQQSHIQQGSTKPSSAGENSTMISGTDAKALTAESVGAGGSEDRKDQAGADLLRGDDVSVDHVDATKNPSEIERTAVSEASVTQRAESSGESKHEPEARLEEPQQPQDDLTEPASAAFKVQMRPPAGPAALMASAHVADGVGRGRGHARGVMRGAPTFRGRGNGNWPNGVGQISPRPQTGTATTFPAVVPVEPKGLGVVGAPKAPKALREGLPNTSVRGRGFAIMGRAGRVANIRNEPRTGEDKSDDEGERKHVHESRKKRSRNYEDDEVAGEADERYEKRRRSSSVDTSASRSTSPRPSKRSSHRSRHEGDKGDSRRHRSSRKHGDEERRKHERGSDSPSKMDGIKAITSEDVKTNHLASVSGEAGSGDPETGSRRSRDKKHRLRARSVSDDENDRDGHRQRRSYRDESGRDRRRHDERKRDKTAADENHHDRDREERNRERMLKEQQRREDLKHGRERTGRDKKRDREGDEVGINGDESRGKRRRHKHESSRKTGGDGDEEATRSRRVSYKYEDEESDEARAMRVESEREASRWK
ncbi:MAG: hypothetical protein M1817_001345 [Caeruleum heppii]|nr:MAG: hypothetical protein M1817_001345 [Caeruleum heppii]